MIKKTGKTDIAIRQIVEIRKATKAGIKKSLHHCRVDLVKEGRRLIKDTPKTGRLYRINGKLHRASKAGEAPASINKRTGLLASIAGKQSNLELEFGARSKINYAKYLEKGTKRMASRPFISKSINNKTRDMQRHFINNIDYEINK